MRKGNTPQRSRYLSSAPAVASGGGDPSYQLGGGLMQGGFTWSKRVQERAKTSANT